MPWERYELNQHVGEWVVVEITKIKRRTVLKVRCRECEYEMPIDRYRVRNHTWCPKCKDPSSDPTPEEIEKRKQQIVDEECKPLSLNQALQTYGYSTQKPLNPNHSHKREILRNEEVVFVGDAQAVWDWLKKTHPKFFERET